MFDAKIEAMSEYTKHHVKADHTEMFPQARRTKLDMNELGAQLQARKDELIANSELIEAPPVPASPAMAATA